MGNNKNNKSFPMKCGEIMVSVKKNKKNLYSFNCIFCDEICVQIKKFTLHIEQEHSGQLEADQCKEKANINSIIEKDANTNQVKIESLFEEKNIKCEESPVQYLEECPPAKVITRQSKKDSTPVFEDPLEPIETLIVMEEKTHNILSNDVKATEPEETVLENYPEDNTEDDNSHVAEDDNEQADEVDFQSDSSADEYSASDSEKDCKQENETCAKTKRRKRSESSEDSKEVILAIIEAYKNKPDLWVNGRRQKLNITQKHKIFEDITTEINNNCGTSFAWNVLRRKITRICLSYQRQIEHETKNLEESKAATQLWYTEQMEFLKETALYKIKRKRRKPKYRVKPLNDSSLFDLIDIYQKYTLLWDTNHLAYTIREKRAEALEQLLNEVNEKTSLQLDLYKLDTHLRQLHNLFGEEKRKRIDSAGNEEDQLDSPTSVYYEKCKFLKEHQGPFKCELCMEIIATYRDYQVHLSQHKGSKKLFQCKECGSEFTTKSNYKIHAESHLRVFKFYCKICAKGFPFSGRLKTHMLSHTGETPYLCSVCGEGFRNAMNYDNHIRRHEERFRYHCDICQRGFNSLTQLNDHVKAHLNVRDKVCNVCGKTFTSRRYLNHHKRIHGEKKYVCKICGKSFAQDSGLRQHKKNHGIPIGASSLQRDDKYSELM